jgi:rubrerythrin
VENRLGEGVEGMNETPLLFKSVKDEVKAAVFEEKEAIDDYAELENKLRKAGLISNADVVNEIRSDEVDHLAKFEMMLREVVE